MTGQSRNSFRSRFPFYAATEAFNYFREKFPGFAYKEAALNPTNLRDRTADWEADVVSFFHNNPAKTEFVGRRDTPSGSSLYLSTPIRVDSDSCLTCHGPADKAPPEIVKLYGAGNGFGWQLNDVIGAQIVSVPAEVAHNRAAAAMKTVSIWLAGVFAGLYLIVNAIVFVFISRLVPAQRAQ
jgi:protein-histidine pros-kinase